MLGPPKDVKGECNARLFLGDDYGDNECTCRCMLKPGHTGPHEERFERGPSEKKNEVKIIWTVDEK